jgi:hypothetical protein
VIATIDPHVWIEEQFEAYVRYRADDGRCWEVHGVCDHNRACMVGAVVDGALIESVAQARALPRPKLDCPVGPGFSGCCELKVAEL